MFFPFDGFSFETISRYRFLISAADRSEILIVPACSVLEVLKLKAGQLDPLSVYLFVSRDMYTEKTAQRVMIYVPSAGCKMFPPGGRVPDVKGTQA